MPTQPVINQVRERYLFLSPLVQGKTEREACSNDFEVISGLGQGAFGKVYKVRHKVTKQVFALKQIQKKQIKQQKMIQQIINEVKIMYNIDHQNIIKLFNHYEEEEYIYLVLECATGGQLWHKLNSTGRFDENTVRQYMREIMSAIEYLHTKKPPIIHRDIKPENILLDKDGQIKLADFGWSNFFNDTKRQTYCGTLDYLAPEMILEAGHDEKLDYWSLGVLAFELLTGKAPFTPSESIKDPREQQKQLENNILKVNIVYPPDFPTLAKTLIQGLLIKDPSKRFTIQSMRDHPWIQAGKPQQENLQKQIGQNIVKKDDIREIISDDKGQFSKQEIADIMNRQKKEKLEEETQIIVNEQENDNQNDPTKTTVHILNEKIQDLSRQVNETKVLLQVKTEENQMLQKQIKTSQPVVTSLAEQRKVRLLEEEKEKVKKDLDKLWEELRVKESAIAKLTTENRRIDDLQRQIDKYKGDKIILQEKVKRLNEELQHKDNEIMELKSERESVMFKREKQGGSFISQIGGTSMNLAADESFTSNMSILDLSTSFNEMKQRFQLAKEQIEEFDKAQRRIIQLEGELIQCKGILESQKNEIRQDLQFQFEEEFENLQHQNILKSEQFQQKIQQLKDESSKEKDDLRKKITSFDSYQIENDSLKKQIISCNSIIQDMKQEWEQNKKIRQQYEIRLKEMEITILDLREQERQVKRK